MPQKQPSSQEFMNTDFSFFSATLYWFSETITSLGEIPWSSCNFSRNHPERLSPITPTCRIHFAPGDGTTYHIPLEFPIAAKLSYNSLYRSARYAIITVAIPASGKTQGALAGRVAISSGDFGLYSRFYHRIPTELASVRGQATTDVGYYVSYWV